MKVQFIRKVHNKTQINKRKKTLKGCKINNKIQINKNIERVQDRQQDTNRQKHWKGAKQITKYK
jgi:hypothetical protein